MRTKEYYEVQIHKLTQKDAAANSKIIKKLQRRLRRAEEDNNES